MNALQMALLVSALSTLLPASPMLADKPSESSGGGQQMQVPRKPRALITISKETTRISEPVRDEGYVDYLAALNKHASEGVTPENNAAVLIWQAVGPGAIEPEARQRYFAMLGILPLAEQGDYFVPLEDFARQRETGDLLEDLARIKEVEAELDRAVCRPWSKKKYPLLADWLAANQRPLALALEASRRPRRYDPLISPKADGTEVVVCAFLPSLYGTQQVVGALSARAMLHTEAGDFDRAWTDLLACHRLARLSGQGPTLTDAMVAFAIERIACQADQALMLPGQLSADKARKMRVDLQALPALPSIAEKIDVFERYGYLDAVTLMAREGPSALKESLKSPHGSATLERLVDSAGRAKVDWDLILRVGNARYDRLVAALNKPTRRERWAAAEKVADEIDRAMKKSRDIKSFGLAFLVDPGQAVSRQIGDTLAGLILPAVFVAASHEEMAAMRPKLNRLGFALAAYHAEHGVYPAKLAELVPDCATEIPEDVFAGRPLKYERQADGYLLYSVGQNGVDDGGREVDPEGYELWDDLIVRVRAR